MDYRTFFSNVLLMFVLVVGVAVLAIAEEEASPTHDVTTSLCIEDQLRLIGSHDKNVAEREPIYLKLLAREKSCHDVLPVLVRSLKSEDARIRCAAVHAISYFAPQDKTFLPAVEQLLNDEDLWVRLGACESAWIIGQSKNAVDEATSLLDNSDRSIRAYAVLLIADMGKDAAFAASKLVDRLSEPDETIGLCVCNAIAKMGLATIEPLLEKTKHQSPRIRSLAIACLGSLNIVNHRITKAILLAMNDTDWEVRDSAVGAVSELQIRETLVTDKLITLLNDPEIVICESTTKTLADIGDNRAIPALEKTLKDRHDACVREAVAYSLGKLRAVTTVPTLESVMQEERTMLEQDATREPSVRVAIITALGCMGATAIQALEHAKNDPDCSVREAVSDALQQIQLEMKRSKSATILHSHGCKKCWLQRCYGLQFITQQSRVTKKRLRNRVICFVCPGPTTHYTQSQ